MHRLAVAGLLAALALGSALAQSSAQNLDWPHYGNDLGNMRYQDTDQINPDNVSQLKPAWIFYTGVLDPSASLEASPIVIDGTMYVTTGHDDVYALDAATGEMKWAYHPKDDMPDLSKISICCGRDNRGVAYADGKVFLGRLDDVLVALDAVSGEVLWKTAVADWQEHSYAITMAPQVVDGKVIVAPSGGDFESRGFIAAYDAATGKEAWRFWIVPTGGETGSETWAGDSWKSGAGNAWTTPAVDPDLGLVYFSTGNAGPDFNGKDRAGKNLYTASVVALDAATGALKWYF